MSEALRKLTFETIDTQEIVDIVDVPLIVTNFVSH